MNLFEKLNIKPDLYDKKLIDEAYRKNPKERLSWKILRDKYFFDIYKKYLSIDYVIKARFIDDNYNDEEIYNIDILTTPFNKLKKEYDKKPVVLLTTGGFYPIHDGHINMMEKAKEYLEKNGYSVLGGYLSPCNNIYTNTKPNFNINKYERVNLETRASLNPIYIGEFSKKIIDINIDFYKNINENIKLSEININFIKLMKYHGFSENEKLINILNYLNNIIK